MKLSEFQTEYYDELNRAEVDEMTLKSLGIKSATLAKEAYLRDIYGDKIFYKKSDVDEEPKKNNEPVVLKKSITKLSSEEINFKSELDIIQENIEKSNFDDELGYLVKKLEG